MGGGGVESGYEAGWAGCLTQCFKGWGGGAVKEGYWADQPPG